MRSLITPLAALLLANLAWPPAAHAQTDAANQCTQALQQEIATEHRIFRAVLFGHRSAEAAPIGYVTYETDGSAWYKVSDTAWRSADEGFRGTTHFNNLIDERSEITAAFGTPDRRGIFETKRKTTSELLPYIGTSLRAFQCRLYQFCNAVNQSKALEGDEPQTITATYPGCQPIERPSIPECHINKRGTVADSAIIFNNCQTAVDALLQQESRIINLAVQYDAAYRTLLQLAGSVDLFLEELHWPMTHSLQDATELIGILGRIPCYATSCEAFPPPSSE